MNWDTLIKDFESYLKLEKSLSKNSVEAYIRDISKLKNFMKDVFPSVQPHKVEYPHLKEFINSINDQSVSPRSQARLISGIKAFYKYLLLEDVIDKDPTAQLEPPKIGKKLPSILTIEEVDLVIDAIELSKPEGVRNKAMLETLYSCGLRVSELIDLRISNMFLDQGYVKIMGKGSKERLIPISKKANSDIHDYLEQYRSKVLIKNGSEDILFLNRRGSKLTRVMVFTIIKDLTKKIGLQKNISPHTFRHSFASHLIEGGADLRAVQEMLGHESIVTTEIYTHIDKTFLRDSIIQFHPRS